MDARVRRNSKRIARNTLLLYFRMLFLMAVSLYTSRVVLEALGVEDFGIYNVVGGMVVMFGMVSGSFSSAVMRFMSYELGKGDGESLAGVFSSAVAIQSGLAAVVVLLAETAGLWFLNAEMNIPGGRMPAANWVFQFSVLTFAVNLISIPYNAAIVAHERMSAFAYIGILEAVSKLAVAFLVTASPADRLVSYAALTCAVALGVRLAYGVYCRHHFEECTRRFAFDRRLSRRMFGFAGWGFFGASMTVLRDQGGNVLINLFCGPAVNAARGIAFQVGAAVNSFASNFMTALNPQITKQYAAGNREYMMALIFKGARFSFYLLLFLSLPVLANTHYVLELWLKSVPEHTVFFVRLVLMLTMSESVSLPLMTAMGATGRIRNYQLAVSALLATNLPVSYFLLRAGAFPEIVVIVAIVVSQGCLAVRLLMMRDPVGLSVRQFMRKVYANIVFVFVSASAFPLWLSSVLEESFPCFALSCLVCLASTGCAVCFVGCGRAERRMALAKIGSMRRKLTNQPN